MKKGWIILIAAVVMIFIIVASFSSMYNGLVTTEEAVTGQWANVENVYQRRSDLIPNLVNTVKGYADFEKSTLTDVVEARAKATSITVDPTKLTPEALQNSRELRTD